MNVPELPEMPEVEEPDEPDDPKKRKGGNTLWASGKLGLFLAAVFGYYKFSVYTLFVPVLLVTGAEYMRFRFSRNTEVGWGIIGLLSTSAIFSLFLYGAGRLAAYFWPWVQ
ncbi:hypothetical protein [Rhizobium ruizarguesonis]|uniref:hypothetical protein n=1 Tax=Rhizobium ruizarguesonis TaxID=2081791 RepID=UPI003723C639